MRGRKKRKLKGNWHDSLNFTTPYDFADTLTEKDVCKSKYIPVQVVIQHTHIKNHLKVSSDVQKCATVPAAVLKLESLR